MRLWHQKLISKLPMQQLLGQHREVCALRGLGWGRKHSTVDYVFTHPVEWLVAYHWIVIGEMGNRGYKVDAKWCDALYRGKISNDYEHLNIKLICELTFQPCNIYPEHDDAYYQECVENLRNKGIVIE